MCVRDRQHSKVVFKVGCEQALCALLYLSSREDLEVNRLLHHSYIFYKLAHLFFAMNLGVDFGDVLTKDVGAPVTENGPQVLHERLAKEYESLLAAVLEVDVEVVLADALRVGSKLVLDFLHEFALAGHL